MMDNLYEKICDLENIYVAYKKATKGKKYRDEALRFSHNLPDNLLNIEFLLKNKKYCHSQYYEFLVKDSKKRIIRAACLKDRIMHHALCNIINDFFERSFIFDSYACRKEKGAHRAIKRFRTFLKKIKTINELKNKNNVFCLKCDIVKYFDSVDKEILIKLIKRKIQDSDVLNLIMVVLNSYGPGLPIGNLTSQLFANIYLHELDFYVKNTLKCKYYIRYMDDFVLLDVEKQKLWNCYGLIKDFLRQELKLKIDDNKTKLTPIRKGVIFLGFKIYPNKVLLREDTVKRFKKRLRKELKEWDDKIVPFVALKFKNWASYYTQADSKFFIKRLYCKVVEKYVLNIWEFANRL